MPKKLDSTLNQAEDVTSDNEGDELARGKIVEYLERLNDTLLKYESDRVEESANINHERFLQLLKTFIDFPNALKMMAAVKDEPLDDYRILKSEQAI